MYLYNSASRKKELFVPNHPDIVKMYTCGPTVYHYAHIGNLRSYIMEDVLEKYLRYVGYPVKRVMNITDVGHLTSDADEGEDKMLKGARREHKSVMEIAKFYTDAFFDDCRKLNIKCTNTVTSWAKRFCSTRIPGSFLCSSTRASMVSLSNEVNILMYFSASSSLTLSQNW